MISAWLSRFEHVKSELRIGCNVIPVFLILDIDVYN